MRRSFVPVHVHGSNTVHVPAVQYWYCISPLAFLSMSMYVCISSVYVSLLFPALNRVSYAAIGITCKEHVFSLDVLYSAHIPMYIHMYVSRDVISTNPRPRVPSPRSSISPKFQPLNSQLLIEHLLPRCALKHLTSYRPSGGPCSKNASDWMPDRLYQEK